MITSLLVEEWQRKGSLNLKQFYLRRSLRLMPAFTVFLAIFALVIVLGPEKLASHRWRELLVAACYFSNWYTVHGIELISIGHTWSLSLEEQFYLIWPVLLYGMFRWKISRRQILQVVMAGIIVSALWRMGLHHQHRLFENLKTDVFRMYAGLDTRADALLVGCLTALLAAWNLLPKSKYFISTIKWASRFAVVVLGFCLLRRDAYSSQYYDGLYTVVAVSVAVIIVRLLAAPSGIGMYILQLTPLVGIGRISYGLYLFHCLIISSLEDNGLGWRHPLNTTLIAVLSLAAALLSFFCVERPFLQLKNRLGSTHAAIPENQASADEAPRRMVA